MNSEDEIRQLETQKPVYLEINFQIVCTISLIAVLGVSSVTPAFPSLAKALNIQPQNLGLLVTAFTLPTLVLGPVIGVLADRIGRKKIIVPALILFGIAGTACGLVRDFNLLLFLRLLQGIGAAPLLSLSTTLIGDLYTGARRMTAMGYNASVSSIGTASYPTIGGALATLGWFYPFLLPIVAIPIGLIVFLGLKNPEPKGDRNLQEYLTNAAKILKNRRLFGLFIASAANFVLLYGAYVTYFPQLINDTFKAPASVIGILLSSVSVAIIISSSQLGRLARIYPATNLIQISFILYALALAIVPFMPSIWFLLIPTTIFGIGLGLGFPSIQTLLADLAPKEYLATILSVNGTFFGLGQTLGPVLMGIAFSIGGINSVFYTGVGFAILIFFVFRYLTCTRG
ncbi:MFS transporter [Calothrix sp. FACHB-1219]|uniref:MFS transporter n=1 Tax=unclassified Calothrix TaxID=2619626 RepID=UPI00168795DC|nr:MULTISPECIES: MFS transporter [unclassified Calothrix]MBD2202879.1 MFS transporter [Calothrix sp. FACHB-168]MBD2216007.1 MFS transporter [Calothrix sp. FACHB-1219]